jgi:hypothetical protein
VKYRIVCVNVFVVHMQVVPTAFITVIFVHGFVHMYCSLKCNETRMNVAFETVVHMYKANNI